MSPRYKCPVCGQAYKQLQQHLKRKNDKAHRQWRERNRVDNTDQQQNQQQPQQPQQPSPNNPNPSPTPQGKQGNHGQNPADIFQGQQAPAQQQQANAQQTANPAQHSHGGRSGGMNPSPAQSTTPSTQSGAQHSGSGQYTHNCDGYNDKQPIQQGMQQCPRCGDTLAWGAHT